MENIGVLAVSSSCLAGAGAHWGGAALVSPSSSPASAFSGSGTRPAPCPCGNQRSSRAAWSQARQLAELEGSPALWVAGRGGGGGGGHWR
jgi:hypothetical protein